MKSMRISYIFFLFVLCFEIQRFFFLSSWTRIACYKETNFCLKMNTRICPPLPTGTWTRAERIFTLWVNSLIETLCLPFHMPSHYVPSFHFSTVTFFSLPSFSFPLLSFFFSSFNFSNFPSLPFIIYRWISLPFPSFPFFPLFIITPDKAPRHERNRQTYPHQKSKFKHL